MNMCSWNKNSRLHFLNRDYPLPLSNRTVFSATTEICGRFSVPLGISFRSEPEISGVSKFLEKRRIYKKNISAISVVFHLILYRRFLKFCLMDRAPHSAYSVIPKTENE